MPRRDNHAWNNPETLERRARVIQLRNSGMTLRQIAIEMGFTDADGSPSTSKVAIDIQRSLERARKELVLSVEEMIQLQDQRLDEMRRVAYGMIAKHHYMRHNGQVVFDADGEPVKDDSLKLQAIDRLLKIEERWAKLHGTDATKELKIALDRRVDMEASAVTEAILAGFDAAELPAEKRMLALEAAQVRLSTIDGEVVEETEGSSGE